MNDWTGGSRSVFTTIGARNYAKDERERYDYYATDPIAIDKLLTVERPCHRVWECACGGGHLAERLVYYSFCVHSTDIVDRGYKRHARTIDFLETTERPFNNSFDILTNPPYKHAKEFVLKALDLLPKGSKCYMFLKLTFLEGKARREEIFTEYPPKSVYVFSERVLCAKNGDFEALKKSGGSAVAYAWFVWQKGYKGETTLCWI